MKIGCLDIEMVAVFGYPARFSKPCRFAVSIRYLQGQKRPCRNETIYSNVNFSDKISFLKS